MGAHILSVYRSAMDSRVAAQSVLQGYARTTALWGRGLQTFLGWTSIAEEISHFRYISIVFSHLLIMLSLSTILC